jgi:uncharacterized membrane protein YedE/YeeE
MPRIVTALLAGRLFGLGWGLLGYCPGPALASLTLAGWRVSLFVVAMLAGMAMIQVFDRKVTGGPPWSRSVNRTPSLFPSADSRIDVLCHADHSIAHETSVPARSRRSADP